MIGLIAFAQFSTIIAIYLTISNDAIETANQELRVGGRVFTNLLESRAEQLQVNLKILAADFGFKEAMASKDLATVESALVTHGERIAADILMLVSLEGYLVVSTHHDTRDPSKFPFPKLLEQATLHSYASDIVLIDDALFQVALVPMHAPTQIAWVAMGFSVDNVFSQELKQITNLELSFIKLLDKRRPLVMASSLDHALLNRLEMGDVQDQLLFEMQVGNSRQNYITYILQLGEQRSAQIFALLQRPVNQVIKQYEDLRWHLVGITSLLLLLSILGAVFISRGILRPIRQLAHAAQRIQEGMYGQLIAIKSKDEFGLLAKAFNKMQQGIADREMRIVHQAKHDELTSLPNRTVIEDRFEMAVARANREKNSFCLLLMDIDDFKLINVAHGQQMGDKLLRSFAQRLLKSIRETDSVARLGGDQFVLILEEIAEASAVKLCEKIHALLSRPYTIGDNVVEIRLHVGMALFPGHGVNYQILLRRADIAMHNAKHSRSIISVYRPGEDEQRLRRIALTQALCEALHKDELFMQYQPKVSMEQESVTQVEALLRWIHPEFGFIPPDEFIQLAEESGNIRLLTNWVIRRVIRQIKDWEAQDIDVVVAVNLSALDLEDPLLGNSISRILKEYNVSAAKLIFEITENAVMHNPAEAIQVLKQLKHFGCKFSIDDFGTGHSSLIQLKQLPVDELKIDRSFVMNLDANQDDAIIVRSTIDLGHNMGLKVVAEGVESAEVWALLASFQCDTVQGFYISRPLNADDLVQWLQEKGAVHMA